MLGAIALFVLPLLAILRDMLIFFFLVGNSYIYDVLLIETELIWKIT